MTGGERDLAASVAARLLNRARRDGDDYQTLLTRFCFERLLHRLGASDLRDRFVLKGAVLLGVWSRQPYRATRDLDLLRLGDATMAAVRRDLARICEASVAPDAVRFDAAAIRVSEIRAEHEDSGYRAVLSARCGSARLSLQIDMGVGDAVWPAARPTTFPVPVPDAPGVAFVALLGALLIPIVEDLRRGEPRAGSWKPGGPWT